MSNREFPELQIVLNGGIASIDDCREHLRHVDGVKIGRRAYHRPWFLTELGREFGSRGETVSLPRVGAIWQLTPYVKRELANGTELKHITRDMLKLSCGQPGSPAWRRYWSEHAHDCRAGVEVLEARRRKLPDKPGTNAYSSA